MKDLPSDNTQKKGDMAIVIDRGQGMDRSIEARIGLECPYCGVYAHMSPPSGPDAASLMRDKPKHVGVVYKCDSCDAPVFLRFAVREYKDNRVELYRNFIELERPKERFAFSYLPKHTEVLFREGLSCYSNNNFNAFASMCRRASISAFEALGEGGKLRAFEEVMVAQDIAGIDDEPRPGRRPARGAERHAIPVLRAPRKTDARDKGAPFLRLGTE